MWLVSAEPQMINKTQERSRVLSELRSMAETNKHTHLSCETNTRTHPSFRNYQHSDSIKLDLVFWSVSYLWVVFLVYYKFASILP